MEYPLPGDKGVISKLRLRLETGLKHQIRVQAAAEGLPLIGDRIVQPTLPPTRWRGGASALFAASPARSDSCIGASRAPRRTHDLAGGNAKRPPTT